MDRNDIAIVGMGCRLPGANGPDELWQLLQEGRDTVSVVPPDRWDVDTFYDPGAGVPGKMNTRWGGFLDDVAGFDTAFFGLSPRNADYMDPQHRLLLETAWEALESAGIPPGSVRGSECGTYIGMSANDYGRGFYTAPETINAYCLMGNAMSVAANRLSYFFDLRGPSMVVDTACSSSLVAVHLACTGLRAGETDLALAGGANLTLLPHTTIAVSQLWLTSPSGRCKSFAADADGYVRAEGCGVVVLKRLSDALADRDPVLAVIRGSAVNQNGRGNGITAPSATAQEAVVRRALQSAGVTPDQIQYVEAHGSGARQNDDIELTGLIAALGERRPSNAPCMLGSIKTNIGSLEAAAGFAGLLKVVLALQHDTIPAHIHARTPNPLISESGVFELPRESRPWPASSDTRLASVHSYGIGGTNAHVVVEEARPTPEAVPADEPGPYLLVLSARTPEALSEMARRYAAYLGETPAVRLSDVCFTAATGREVFAHKLAIIASSAEDLRSMLLDAANAGEHGSLLDMLTEAGPRSATLRACGMVWLRGDAVDWDRIFPAASYRRVPLPTYPFQRSRHWIS